MLPSLVWQSFHLRRDTLVWGVYAEMSWRWLNVMHGIIPVIQYLMAQEGYWAKLVMQGFHKLNVGTSPPPFLKLCMSEMLVSFIHYMFAYVWNISSIWKLIQYRIFLCLLLP